MTCIVGWDLGGANIKLARLEDGRVTGVVQILCPLLQGRTKFDSAIAEGFSRAPRLASHAVTMTGELSDVFADRQDGVRYLVDLMVTLTKGQPLMIYAGTAGFLDADQAVERWRDVASANWQASAALAARQCPEGLLVDIGTTTTDLIPLRAGAPAARGLNDGERLTEGELVYTGAVRTPVMAVAHTAPFKGRVQGIAAERFATMADVWRLTGDLPDGADPYPTPDLKGKTAHESAVRLARMLGRDASEAAFDDWVALACYVADCQLAQIEGAAWSLIEREALKPDAVIVGAGCGRFMVEQLAKRLGHPYRDFADLVDCAPEARDMAAACAPAVAVAVLAGERAQ